MTPKERRFLSVLLLVVTTGCITGCFWVKTEHEVKPIHITMDVNLKVQKELEDFLCLD